MFESKVVGGNVPKEFIPGVEKGLESAKENGLLAGFPVIDFKATLIDGAYHDVDSSVLAFEIAARAAFRELREKGAPEAARADHEGRGDDAGGLRRRRHRRPELAGAARSRAPDQRGNAQVIIAMVPLANMFGYVNTLRVDEPGPRRTSTWSTTTTKPVPQAVADEVVKKYA